MPPTLPAASLPPSRWSERARSPLWANLATAAAATLVALLLVEIGFRLFVTRSDSFRFTIAGQRWNQRYWKPVNHYGFRDQEYPDPATVDTRRKLFVVGDSIVAGAGIEDPADRFSDRLAVALGQGWLVFNFARSGWSTRDQLEALRRFPYHPDVIVLSYFVNDIEGAALALGSRFSWVIWPPSFKWIWPAVTYSHALNFFYWGYRVRTLGRQYFDFLRHCYADERIWTEHAGEIRALVVYAHQHNTRLVAVVFPELQDVDAFRPYTTRVVDLLRSEGVAVIDLTVRFQGRPRATLVVNAMDPHPNHAVHREVADLILQVLRQPATEQAIGKQAHVSDHDFQRAPADSPQATREP